MQIRLHYKIIFIHSSTNTNEFLQYSFTQLLVYNLIITWHISMTLYITLHSKTPYIKQLMNKT